MGDEPVSAVISLPLRFIAVLARLEWDRHDSSIANEGVESRFFTGKLFCSGEHGSKVHVVQD
jgi:hypothetical protein